MVVGALTNIFRPTEIDNVIDSMAAFHDLDNDSVDVMIYGSSHSWLGINTKLLTEEYGLESFNYSAMWQSINTVDLFVKDSFESQTPKLAIVDTGYVDKILENADLIGEIYYTKDIPNSDYKREYLETCFGGDRGKIASYYIPFSYLHGNWTTMNESAFRNAKKVEDAVELFKSNRGYLGFDYAMPVDIRNEDEYWQEALPEAAIRYLDDIVNECKAHNTEVLFVTVPTYSSEFIYGNALEMYAKENGCRYIDFLQLTDELQLDGNADFMDNEHLNNVGSAKLTAYLANYIKENYNF